MFSKMENIERKTEWLFSGKCCRETISLRDEWCLHNISPTPACSFFTDGCEAETLIFPFFINFFQFRKKFFSFFIISPASCIAPQGFH